MLNNMLLGNCKFKQWDITTHLLKWLKSKTLTAPKLRRMWDSRNFHSLLVEMQNGSLEESPVVSCKIKCAILCIYPNELKTMSAQKLHMNVYSSFIHNCPNLEATKMSINRQMHKPTVVHPYNGIWFSAERK